MKNQGKLIKALILGLCFLALESTTSKLYAQKIAIKTNLAHWAVPVTPNFGAEFALGNRVSIELTGGLNPRPSKEIFKNKYAHHWIVQPEVRFWFCEVMNGHFIGTHAHLAQYNVGGWNIPIGRFKAFKDSRYQGFLYGAGLSYGYQWVLSPRWNFELNLGGGYARIQYDKYPCVTCGARIDKGYYNYWGITKAAISFIYIIK